MAAGISQLVAVPTLTSTVMMTTTDVSISHNRCSDVFVVAAGFDVSFAGHSFFFPFRTMLLLILPPPPPFFLNNLSLSS